MSNLSLTLARGSFRDLSKNFYFGKSSVGVQRISGSSIRLGPGAFGGWFSSHCKSKGKSGRVIRESSMAMSTAGDSGGGGVQKRGEFRVFENVDELSTSLADYVAELSEVAVKERGAFAVVLSGGSLISLLGKLTEAPYIKTVDWAEWHVFWVDERVVAKNHPESNYKLAKDGLLSKVPIIPGHVYSINDSLSAENAAEDYAFGLRQLVKTRIVDVAKITDCPKFDLILLGMGPDGHIASLFPNHPLINEKEEWVAFITDSPKPPPERITFTLPVINSAANVAVVVTGAGKAETLKKVFGEELPHGSLPAQMVSPIDGNLVWLVDKEAASKIVGHS
uniref:6-phosphogluconolactonase n=2 Tax=Wollemia nobilis TaxID=56998 RepID=A0A0C9RZ39_9CONI